MTDINNQFWKHTTATTTIDVVVDDDLSIQDSYITNFASDKQVSVYEKEANGFIQQNDEGVRDKYDKYGPGRKINIGGVEMNVIGVLPPTEKPLTKKQLQDVVSYIRANGTHCTGTVEVQTNTSGNLTPADCCCPPGQGISEAEIPYRPAPPYDPELAVQPCGWISASRMCGCYVTRTIVKRCSNGQASENEEFVPLIDSWEDLGNDNYPNGFPNTTSQVACRTTIKTRQFERSEIDFTTGERCDYYITETQFCEVITVIVLTRGCDNRQAPFAIDPSEMTPILNGGGSSGQLLTDGGGLSEVDAANDISPIDAEAFECLKKLMLLPGQIGSKITDILTCLADAAVDANDVSCELVKQWARASGQPEPDCDDNTPVPWDALCALMRFFLKDMKIYFPFICPNSDPSCDEPCRKRRWKEITKRIKTITLLQPFIPLDGTQTETFCFDVEGNRIPCSEQIQTNYPDSDTTDGTVKYFHFNIDGEAEIENQNGTLSPLLAENESGSPSITLPFGCPLASIFSGDPEQGGVYHKWVYPLLANPLLAGHPCVTPHLPFPDPPTPECMAAIRRLCAIIEYPAMKNTFALIFFRATQCALARRGGAAGGGVGTAAEAQNMVQCFYEECRKVDGGAGVYSTECGRKLNCAELRALVAAASGGPPFDCKTTRIIDTANAIEQNIEDTGI